MFAESASFSSLWWLRSYSSIWRRWGSNWPANRESASSWKDFLVGIKTRGLHGVSLVISDDHPGLRRAVIEVLPEALWRRCYDFLRNALAYLPRHKAADDCLVELRWMYERRDAAERRRDLASWLAKWPFQMEEKNGFIKEGAKTKEGFLPAA